MDDSARRASMSDKALLGMARAGDDEAAATLARRFGVPPHEAPRVIGQWRAPKDRISINAAKQIARRA